MVVPGRRRRHSNPLALGDRAFHLINNTFLVVFLVVVAYPILYIVSASLSDPLAVISGRVWLLPVGFNLEGYIAVFNYRLVWIGYANSLIYASAGTAINVVMVILAGYPLSRRDLFGRRPLMVMFTFTMIFNGGLIPTYMVVRDLGIMNTRWALLLPVALNIWNMIIARTYFVSTIPEELLEASQMDGCNDFRFISRVVLPLSGPIIAVMILFHAVIHWNQYFSALLYLNDQKLYPLQLILRQILILNEPTPELLSRLGPKEAAAREALVQLLRYSLIVLASLPVVLLYPFVQRYFVKGVMIGALKG